MLANPRSDATLAYASTSTPSPVSVPTVSASARSKGPTQWYRTSTRNSTHFETSHASSSLTRYKTIANGMLAPHIAIVNEAPPRRCQTPFSSPSTTPPDDLSPDDASSPPSDDLSSDADSSPPSVDSDGRPTDPVSSKSGRRRVRRHARRAACARLMLLSASTVSPDAITHTQPPSLSAAVAASPSLMQAGPPMHPIMDVDLWAHNLADYAPGTYLCLTHGRTIVLGAYELDGHSFDGCEDCMCHAESFLRQ